jgi:hypothetical protein
MRDDRRSGTEVHPASMVKAIITCGIPIHSAKPTPLCTNQALKAIIKSIDKVKLMPYSCGFLLRLGNIMSKNESTFCIMIQIIHDFFSNSSSAAMISSAISSTASSWLFVIVLRLLSIIT